MRIPVAHVCPHCLRNVSSRFSTKRSVGIETCEYCSCEYVYSLTVEASVACYTIENWPYNLVRELPTATGGGST